MTAIASALAPVRPRAPRPVLLAIGAAWALAVAAELTGTAGLLHPDGPAGALQHEGTAGARHHDMPSEGGSPWVALPLFLLAWQVMVAAMMLPSSLPLVRLFAAASARQERPRRVYGAFLGGYAAVWTAFGAVALAGVAALDELVDTAPWIAGRSWVVAGSVLALAGAFQFSGLKDRCLTECRHPGPYLVSHYRRGVGAAFRLGSGHGLFCLGCCWALMLVLVAAGFASLFWMAGLAAVTVYEKTGRHGPALARLVGVVLLVWAALVLAQPAWLPSWASGV
jgi:predicted metal-binding membrane protein